MNSKKVIEKYCTGCGLCKAVKGVNLHVDSNGYYHPHLKTEESISFCENVCPSQGTSILRSNGTIWGLSQNVWLGFANDKNIRSHSSSGGMITAICCYLLSANIVDGIIQTKMDPSNPISTITVVSKTIDEVKECSGSRYSISHPLETLFDIVEPNKKYAFVGKPCDVSALRCYLEQDEELGERISILISFFCAGMPSIKANQKLLNYLGCSSDEQCCDLQYRGDGWPGYTTVKLKNGEINKCSYQESWRTILGRDVAQICRLCPDGIGELADISCGDAWYLSDDDKPLFDERDGRNVVFARTNVGLEICEGALNDGVISLIKYEDYVNELQYSQNYQYDRRASLKYMLFALKLLGKETPMYDKKVLDSFSDALPTSIKFRRFGGTIKRVIRGKM